LIHQRQRSSGLVSRNNQQKYNKNRKVMEFVSRLRCSHSRLGENTRL